MAGNLYEVDPVLVGRRVELRYDPEDLSVIGVYYLDQPAGIAVPAELHAHVDPKLRAANPPEPGAATGLSYLDAIVADHAADLANGLTYYQPPPPASVKASESETSHNNDNDGQLPGQTDIHTVIDEIEQEQK